MRYESTGLISSSKNPPKYNAGWPLCGLKGPGMIAVPPYSEVGIVIRDAKRTTKIFGWQEMRFMQR